MLPQGAGHLAHVKMRWDGDSEELASEYAQSGTVRTSSPDYSRGLVVGVGVCRGNALLTCDYGQ